ncbi:hypothetical protein AVEN_139211-1 [Araneus ventricosus]|uniref:Uncharacterized protein n=1 Tax=Araneus ventricosus TaxID=182803 RepID=A0A4Y2WNC4_ARAVE|nr:hypothetical protein AVEN_139211-1 [Araneus ventricosus]
MQCIKRISPTRGNRRCSRNRFSYRGNRRMQQKTDFLSYPRTAGCSRKTELNHENRRMQHKTDSPARGTQDAVETDSPHRGNRRMAENDFFTRGNGDAENNTSYLLAEIAGCSRNRFSYPARKSQNASETDSLTRKKSQNAAENRFLHPRKSQNAAENRFLPRPRKSRQNGAEK